MKGLFLVLSILILTGLVRIASADSSTCDHLYESICGDNAGAARAARLTAQATALDLKLLPRFQELAAKYGMNPPTPGSVIRSSFNNLSAHFAFRSEALKGATLEYLLAIEKELSTRIRIPDFAAIRKRVETTVMDDPKISDSEKSKMIQRIESTVIVLPSEYVREYTVGYEDVLPLLSAVMSDSAWNIGSDEIMADSQLASFGSVIVPLYGMLLAEERPGKSGPEIDFVLSHETSHSVDYSKMPEIYVSLTQCMKDNYRANFNEWNEIAADFWGTNAFARELLESGATPQDSFEKLKDSYEILCDTNGESEDTLQGILFSNVHPSGRFRIDDIVSKNPLIRIALGCEPLVNPNLYCEPSR